MSLAPAFHLEKRQAFGTRGRQTTVTVNCFKVTKAPDGMIQHYDVAWSGNPADKRVLMDWLLKHPSQTILGQAGKMAVFDGKANLFVYTKEKKNKATFTIDERQARKLPPLPPKPAGSKASRSLTVTLTWANEVNAYELIAHVNGQAAGSDGINQVNQAVNLLIKHEPSATFPVTRTSFYPTPNKRGEPVLCSAGLELWRGYFASLRPSIGKSILNFDTVTGLFRKSGNLVDILLRIVGQNDPRRLYDEKMPPKLQVWRNRFLKGLTVELGHTGEKKKYKIRGISRSSASEYTFEVEPGKKETIERHFAKKYNIKLKAPYLPVIQVTATNYVPMEIASVVVGGTFFGKLSPRMDADLVGEMMKSAFTTLKPQQRVEAIKEGLKYLRLRTPVFQHWNFDIDTNPMNVKARVLPPPALSYLDARTNKPSTVTPNDGQWDARGKKGSRVAPRLDKWLVVVFADEGDGRAKGSVAKGAIQQAVSDYVKAASQYGVNISNRQPFIYFAGGHPPNVEQAVIAATKAAGFSPAKPHQFILTFSDKTNSSIYNAVKTLCDLKMGLPCENLSLQKALGAKPSYWSNVAPKINFKLGGVNQTIDGDPPGFKQFPTIVFGADVTHPAGFSMAPSIAAIIGSHDLRAAEYSAEIRLQLARQEIITDLESASLALMMKFSRMTKQKPARVIFFRDGVSEGQFDQVCNEEIPALKRAMAQIPGTKPTLTYIICGKRHHVRFFPNPNSPQDADRSGNVKAGMCVDSDITLPYGQDWYMVSHGGLLGTSRPCHYSVLVDEAKMGPDALQALCFYMAHLYPRSTRSVSIPTPAYLAHHAATRARIHLGPDPDEDNVSSVGEKKKTRDEMEEYKQEKLQQALGRFRTVTGPLADTMYYM